VLAREDIKDQKRLVGYLVLEKDKEEKEVINQCREICKAKLPDYMQPSQIMVLGSMPLTPNGKLDRKALPKPEGREGLAGYAEPRGLIEEQLAKIWQAILKIERIGRNDNFFNLGGHSLLATQLISRIRSNQKVEVPLKAIFEYPGLKDLAKALEKEYFSQGILPPIYPTKEKIIPLSFAQQRLWF
jgi:acyl carrier protein